MYSIYKKQYIRNVNKLKYLGSVEKSYCDIKKIVNERVKVIAMLNLVLWNKNIVNKINTLIFKLLI